MDLHTHSKPNRTVCALIDGEKLARLKYIVVAHHFCVILGTYSVSHKNV